ncbi:MAG: SDR family oxidoreductase [Gemmatimonadales bacterium]
MDLRIENRTALVCGSSSGLGLAIASVLADEGCNVALNGRDETRLDRALERVRERTEARVDGFAADVSDSSQARQLVRDVHSRFGAIDILVCNAGGPPSAPFGVTPEEAWQESLELNLLSTIHLCRTAVPFMAEQGWGRIVCLTSVAAKEPLPGLILSTTARAGVLGFAKSLADEVADNGITVNVVCPGYMRTERVDDLVHQRSEHEGRPSSEIVGELVGRIPMNRMGEPAELAAAVAFLSSEGAAYITGIALQVDGGYIRSIL